MNIHIASVHEGKNPFKCNVCDTPFFHKANLKVHVESVHKGKKPFKCSECDALFSQKVNLNRHVATVHVKFMLEFCNMWIRDRPRFFDQVGHQTTNASIENKHIFSK